MNKNRKRTVQALVLAASVFMLVYFFRDFDLTALSRFRANTYIFVFTIRLVSFFLYQLTYWFLLMAFDERVNFRKLILVVTATSVSNYSTPFKLGFPLQVYLLKGMFGVPYTKGSSFVLFHLVSSYAITAGISLFGLTVVTLNVFESVQINNVFLIGFASIILLFLSGLAMLALKTRFKRLDVVVEKLRMVVVHMSKIRMRYFMFYVLTAIFSFFCAAWMQWVVIEHLGENVSLIHLFLIQGIPFLLGSLSMVPMGLGVRDMSLSVIIASLGVSQTAALTSAAVTRILGIGITVPVGLVALNYLIHKGILERDRLNSQYPHDEIQDREHV